MEQNSRSRIKPATPPLVKSQILHDVHANVSCRSQKPSNKGEKREPGWANVQKTHSAPRLRARTSGPALKESHRERKSAAVWCGPTAPANNIRKTIAKQGTWTPDPIEDQQPNTKRGDEKKGGIIARTWTWREIQVLFRQWKMAIIVRGRIIYLMLFHRFERYFNDLKNLNVFNSYLYTCTSTFYNLIIHTLTYLSLLYLYLIFNMNLPQHNIKMPTTKKKSQLMHIKL